MRSIQNRRVLLICQKIYGYEHFIQREVLSVSDEVDLIYDRPYNLLYRMLGNLNRKLFTLYCDSYLAKVLKYSRKKNYTCIIIIRGSILTRAFMETLRDENKSAKLILYQWDSHANHQYKQLIEYFDECYTFDKADSKKYAIKYLPLFFIKPYNDIHFQHTVHEYFKYDVLILGTLHDERYSDVQYLLKYLNDNGISYYCYLYIPYFRYIKKYLSGKRFHNVRHRTLKTEEIVELFRNSRAVVDLPQRDQIGYTMRTFEVLGSGKKLITTNTNIREEAFYCEDYIKVIDIYNIKISKDFINSTSGKKLLPSIEKYSLSAWTQKLLDDNTS